MDNRFYENEKEIKKRMNQDNKNKIKCKLPVNIYSQEVPNHNQIGIPGNTINLENSMNLMTINSKVNIVDNPDNNNNINNNNNHINNLNNSRIEFIDEEKLKEIDNKYDFSNLEINNVKEDINDMKDIKDINALKEVKPLKLKGFETKKNLNELIAETNNLTAKNLRRSSMINEMNNIFKTGIDIEKILEPFINDPKDKKNIFNEKNINSNFNAFLFNKRGSMDSNLLIKHKLINELQERKEKKEDKAVDYIPIDRSTSLKKRMSVIEFKEMYIKN